MNAQRDTTGIGPESSTTLIYMDWDRDLANPWVKIADVRIVGIQSHDSLQEDLKRIDQWAIEWDMPLNVGK